MNETNQPDKAKKKTMITIAILAAVAIVAILVIVFVNKKTTDVTPEDQTGEQNPVVSEEGEGTPAGEEGEDVVGENLEGDGEVPEALREAREIAPGTNLVTKDNIVVTDTGEPVKMNIDPASSEAPKETGNLSEQDIPDDEYTVKLDVSASGFNPNTFTVSPGQLVNLVLTSTDDYVHIIKFEDEEALLGALLGVAGGETKMKVWNAPTTPGEYRFFCSVPGHERRGEVGTMIVE
jgi:uncharacterized cupredoxin-like copper-binding protein